MGKRPYHHLPPLEHRPDGSPFRKAPPQKRRASGMIRRECCCCEDGSDGAEAVVSVGAVPVGTGDLSDLPGLFKREKTLFDLEDC